MGRENEKGTCGKNELNAILQLQSRIVAAIQMRISSNYAISTEALLLTLARKK
jgi:hypothetical protein